MWICYYVLIGVGLASWLGDCTAGQKLLTVWFSWTNVRKVKLCMMVLCIELYLFNLFSMTLIIFEGHSSVKQF